MKVKICGIKTLKEAEIMNETLPDFVGFVFAESKRKVSYETAFEIKKILAPEIQTVGVFSNASVQEIIKMSKAFDFAQLHGEYGEDEINSLKKAGVKTIRVIRVQKNCYEIETGADYLLFDAFSKEGQGGLNKTFNWDIKIKTNVPFFVAGGLNAENIPEMALKLRPFGADVSSGAEENGFKTKEKVSNIIKVVKGINL